MKKIILIAVLLSTHLYAGTSANLNLKGTIPVILDISINPEALATSLPLDQAVNAQKVGEVVERSNSFSGYKVSVSSQNAGKLVLTGDNTNFVTYQLSYNNGNIPLNVSPTEISSNLQKGQFQRDLHISYSLPSEDLTSGEYTDVLTFTIAAN